MTNPVATIDLEFHHCKWPITDEAPWLHCGAKRAPHSVYCVPHARLAVQPASSRRKRDAGIVQAERVSGMKRVFG